MTRSLLVLALVLVASPLQGQWTNRYPGVAGYGHHVYLEGYELPTMNAGPTDPAVSPDGTRVAFSARGWIWALDVATGRAARVTDGAEMDFRPAWSPDGSRLAFVRDDGLDTWIVVRDLDDGTEETINGPGLDLDPVFTPAGELIYSAATENGLDLHRGDGAPLTAYRGIELRPTLMSGGDLLVYLRKAGTNRVVVRDLESGEEDVLASGGIQSQMRPAAHPNGHDVAYNWATEDGYELRIVNVNGPDRPVRLTTGERGLPLSPTWGPEGDWIWYTEAGDDEVMRLYRIPAVGGDPQEVPIRVWDWGAEVGTLRITTRVSPDETSPAPARIEVVDGSGHPVVPGDDYAQFGLQDGRVFFYSPGVIEVVAPVGEVTVAAVQGLTTPEVQRSVQLRPGTTTEVDLTLEPVWDARATGYLSGDHHFHLNYGGPFKLDPQDLFRMMAGENLDVATPLLANLHNRFEDQELWGWKHAGGLPLIRFAQEVRSHFLGHLGLLDTESLFWPWIWGPGYQAYGSDDRPNADALLHARSEGGLGGYVHPIDDRRPFAPENVDNPPVLLTADGILGNMDWLEVACLWTDEIGTAEMWYRFLNLGVPIALEAGTDVMNNFYRTMAVGTTRLYVDTEGATNFDAYWTAFREGRSFVTTGPMLQFTVEGAEHGDVIEGDREVPFEIELASAVPVETVEVLVNGEVVWSDVGLASAGSRSYQGTIEVPEGGWVAARVHGGAPVWPSMDSYAFAHTSPVWLGAVGSTDPEARDRAAAELRPILEASQERLLEAYGTTEVPRILEVFERARERLGG